MYSPPPKKSYSASEWEAKKLLIVRLYSRERRSMAAVATHLQQGGFLVNERMLKTRIKRWKLEKKLKFPDMRSAVYLMANNGTTGETPTFLVRGRVVPYSEVQRYFHRKGISDPLTWLRSQPVDDGFIPSRDVEILTPPTTDYTPDESDEGVGSSGSSGTDALDWVLPPPTSQDENLQELPLFPAADYPDDLPILTSTSTSLPSSHLELALTSTPLPAQTYLTFSAEKVLHVIDAYCAMYLSSPTSLSHTEPTVHHLTTHAIFAQRIQDGIALMLQHPDSTAAAFAEFERGFSLIPSILVDNHPMSLSLLFSIVCDLDSRHNLGGLIFQLFQHSENVAAISLGLHNPLTTLFYTLTHVQGDATNLSLLVVRRAADHLAQTQGRTAWKSLYLQERLCDCLYYARYNYERAGRRRALFKDQESVYGPQARNTLWTLMNVADDDLQLGRSVEARKSYGAALQRSRGIEDFGGAKTRFAALEGLGKCVLAELTCAEARGEFTSEEFVEGVLRRQGMIHQALRFFQDAEAEARVWFESSSRRIARVRATIAEVENLTSPTYSYLHSLGI